MTMQERRRILLELFANAYPEPLTRADLVILVASHGVKSTQLDNDLLFFKTGGILIKELNGSYQLRTAPESYTNKLLAEANDDRPLEEEPETNCPFDIDGIKEATAELERKLNQPDPSDTSYAIEYLDLKLDLLDDLVRILDPHIKVMLKSISHDLQAKSK